MSDPQNPNRRLALAMGASLAASLGGVLLYRHRDSVKLLFNPFSAEKFELPPVPGLLDASGAAMSGFSAGDIAGKAVFVNAFASWCPNCRAEHRALLDFARSGATIYGVASADDPAQTVKYLQEFGNPFVRVGMDRHAWFCRALGARGIPASFVFAPAPKLAFMRQGEMTLAEFQAQIPPALARAPGRA